MTHAHTMPRYYATGWTNAGWRLLMTGAYKGEAFALRHNAQAQGYAHIAWMRGTVAESLTYADMPLADALILLAQVTA